MKTLSEALPTIKRKSTPEAQNGDILSTQAPSLTKKLGKMSITPSSQNSVSLRQQNNPLDLVRGSQENQQMVSSLLLGCFNTLHTYGKDLEQLIDSAYIFQDLLGEYLIADVRIAFREYMKHNKEMPTPTCIRELIPKPRRPSGLTDKQERQRKRIREEQNNC